MAPNLLPDDQQRLGAVAEVAVQAGVPGGASQVGVAWGA